MKIAKEEFSKLPINTQHYYRGKLEGYIEILKEQKLHLESIVEEMLDQFEEQLKEIL